MNYLPNDGSSGEGLRPPSLFDIDSQINPGPGHGLGHYDEPEEMEYVIKMRGIPWSCTAEDVIDFFGPECQIMGDRDGIHLVKTSEGRATGECFVEMLTERDVETALTRDHQNMGHRYIEVYKVKKVEMDWILKRSRPDDYGIGSRGVGSHSRGRGSRGGSMGGGGNSHGFSPYEAETFVRMRGIPFESTIEDIEQFFSGLAIAPNGIQLVVDSSGKVTGEAYCQFQSYELAEMALQRDRECIGHRYVELFRVTNTELRNQLNDGVHRNNRPHSYGNRPTPYDRPQNRERPSMGRQHMQSGNQRAGSNRQFGRGGGNMGNGSGGGRGGYGRGGGGTQTTWSDYANRVENSWDIGGGGGNSHSIKPAPRPLLPGLKGNQRMNTSAGDLPVLMRGLPWSATEGDITNFFSPIPVRGVQIIFDDTNRPSGSARAFFANSQDQNEALHRHRNTMGSRYIELFIE